MALDTRTNKPAGSGALLVVSHSAFADLSVSSFVQHWMSVGPTFDAEGRRFIAAAPTCIAPLPPPMFVPSGAQRPSSLAATAVKKSATRQAGITSFFKPSTPAKQPEPPPSGAGPPPAPATNPAAASPAPAQAAAPAATAASSAAASADAASAAAAAAAGLVAGSGRLEALRRGRGAPSGRAAAGAGAGAARAPYNPQLATERLGPLHGDKRLHLRLVQWFGAFASNFYDGRAHPTPLLVMMGPPGSGKTFCLKWMAEAHGVSLHGIDPLDYRQTGQPPVKPGPKRRKPPPAKPSGDGGRASGSGSGSDSDSDGGGGGGGGEPDEAELEARALRRLSSGAGQDGEALRQLLMPNTLNQPTVVHVQDVQLCRPEFVRYLLALLKVLARKVPRASAVVMELGEDEAFNRQISFSAAGQSSSSTLGSYLQKQTYCLFLKFASLRPAEARAYAAQYRRRVGLPLLPGRREDADLLNRVLAEAHGDIRQLEILLEWALLPAATEPPAEPEPPRRAQPPVVPRPLSPPKLPQFGLAPPTTTAVTGAATKLPLSVLAGGDGAEEGSSSAVQSDVDVGFLLLRAGSNRPFGYGLAAQLAQQLRAAPVFQAAEFLRSLVQSALPVRPNPVAPAPELGRCSPDDLVQVMIRGLQTEAAVSARRSGSFAGYRVIRQLPALLCCDIFGQVRRAAVRTTFLRQFILDRTPDAAHPTPPPPSAGSLAAASGVPGKVALPGPSGGGAAAVAGPGLTSSSGSGSAVRRAVALMTTDAHGFLQVDAMLPRRRSRPAEQPAEVPIDRRSTRGGGGRGRGAALDGGRLTPVVLSAPPVGTAMTTQSASRAPTSLLGLAVSAAERSALQGIAAVAESMSDFDVNPFVPDGEAHYICRAQWCASSALRALPSVNEPDWLTLARWLHPRRFDFTGASSRRGNVLVSIAAREDDSSADNHEE
jgi:hypothetical protein